MFVAVLTGTHALCLTSTVLLHITPQNAQLLLVQHARGASEAIMQHNNDVQVQQQQQTVQP